jgi:hypothetical protein
MMLTSSIDVFYSVACILSKSCTTYSLSTPAWQDISVLLNDYNDMTDFPPPATRWKTLGHRKIAPAFSLSNLEFFHTLSDYCFMLFAGRDTNIRRRVR